MIEDKTGRAFILASYFFSFCQFSLFCFTGAALFENIRNSELSQMKFYDVGNGTFFQGLCFLKFSVLAIPRKLLEFLKIVALIAAFRNHQKGAHRKHSSHKAGFPLQTS